MIGAKAFGSEAGSKEGKKGADKGVDGRMVFTDNNSGNAKKVIFPDIRAFVANLSHECTNSSIKNL